MNYKYILRWLLIIPSAIASWYMVLMLALILPNYIEAIAPIGIFDFKHTHLSDGYIASHISIDFIFSAFAALAPLVCGVYIAPSHKVLVAYFIYFVGCYFAYLFFEVHNDWGIILGSTITGFIVVLYIRHRYKNT